MVGGSLGRIAAGVQAVNHSKAASRPGVVLGINSSYKLSTDKRR
jgi:hypothetical protein